MRLSGWRRGPRGVVGEAGSVGLRVRARAGETIVIRSSCRPLASCASISRASAKNFQSPRFHGTEFRTKCGGHCVRSFGETRTYGELAAQIGAPKASRAVGAANGRNPIRSSCLATGHRIQGLADGFGGGLPMKRNCSSHEQARNQIALSSWVDRAPSVLRRVSDETRSRKKSHFTTRRAERIVFAATDWSLDRGKHRCRSSLSDRSRNPTSQSRARAESYVASHPSAADTLESLRAGG